MNIFGHLFACFSIEKVLVFIPFLSTFPRERELFGRFVNEKQRIKMAFFHTVFQVGHGGDRDRAAT